MRILIAEDSLSLAATLAEALEKENFIADVANDGRAGYECAASGIYDLVVLDLMLPRMDGYEVLRCLRSDGNAVPVLILSAKSEVEDKLLGFRAGADDYLAKPFDIRELIMRVRAILQRRGGQDFVDLQAGTLCLDTVTCELFNTENRKKVRIAGKELQLLELLLRNQNQVIEKERIVTKVWGFDSNAEYNNVEVYISFLRRKLKFLQVNVSIRAVRGVGYLLEAVDG